MQKFFLLIGLITLGLAALIDAQTEGKPSYYTPSEPRGCCPTETCRASNDPHMKTFDGRLYEIQAQLNQPGEYIMYKHCSLPLQVNGYFWKRGSILYVCGVAVKSGNSIYRYTFCNDMQVPGVVHMGPEVMGSNDGMMVVDSTHRQITLPTGTRIKVNTGSITIFASLEDYNRVGGLCGTFNGRCTDDFKLRDGSYNPFPPHGCTPREHFPQFSESWRVTDPDESLFHAQPSSSSGDCPNWANCTCGIFYCACDPKSDQHQHENVFSGSVTEAATHQRLCTRNFIDQIFTGNPSPMFVDLFPTLTIPGGSRSPVGQNPWPQGGITEAEARDHCDEQIREDRLVVACLKEMVETLAVEDMVEECMLDIKWSRTTDHTWNKVQALQDDCQNQIKRNPDHWTKEGIGNTVKFLSSFCPNACSGHGICREGTCFCDAGFWGDDCSQGQAAETTTTSATPSTTTRGEILPALPVLPVRD